MVPPTADQKQHRSAIGIPSAHDRREFTGRFEAADDTRDFERGGEAVVHQPPPPKSGGVALIGPKNDGRQSITAARAAHLFQSRGVARDTADCRKCLEMFGARIGW